MIFNQYVKTLMVFGLALCSSGMYAAAGYKLTFSNKSKNPYFIFTDKNRGSNPIILKAGENSGPIVLQETKHLYIGTPSGVRKVIAAQVYPFPTIIVTKQVEGFDTANSIFEQGTDMLVRFNADDKIELINQSKKRNVWDK